MLLLLLLLILSLRLADLVCLLRFNKPERDIIKNYKSMHMNQQAAERRFLEENKTASRLCSSDGTPKQLFLYSDAMTSYTCTTPQVRGQKVNKVIDNRVMGTEVVCGQLDTTFLYHTDQLVPGSANLIIEVIRQGTISHLFVCRI